MPSPWQKPPRATIDEYLQCERETEERLVFLDGVVWAMANESDEHGAVSVNLTLPLGNQLRGGSCQVRIKETRVRSGPAAPRPSRTTRGLYSYPDLVVFCGEPEYEEPGGTLVNPTAIIEVLSPGTRNFDRGEKFVRYRDWNSTLVHDVLVEQDRPLVELHTRQADGSWRMVNDRGLEAVVPLPAIGCTLPLTDVYDRITFPDDDAE